MLKWAFVQIDRVFFYMWPWSVTIEHLLLEVGNDKDGVDFVVHFDIDVMQENQSIPTLQTYI